MRLCSRWPQSNQWFQRSTSWMIQDEIFKIVAQEIQRIYWCNNEYEILFGDRYFSHVSICIRTVGEDLVPEGFILTEAVDGETLSNLIIDTLIRLNLPIQSLRCQTYDGAANMAGAFQGVQARIKKLQPLAHKYMCTTQSFFGFMFARSK
eukprot:Pompholyxophrys_punicea_v1_NODE_932_length_1122_cov_3.110487.p1 type:complete len:150 gc:universal NODE_932_length_1122_cov_3.110487:393-842(+)